MRRVSRCQPGEHICDRQARLDHGGRLGLRQALGLGGGGGGPQEHHLHLSHPRRCSRPRLTWPVAGWHDPAVQVPRNRALGAHIVCSQDGDRKQLVEPASCSVQFRSQLGVRSCRFVLIDDAISATVARSSRTSTERRAEKIASMSSRLCRGSLPAWSTTSCSSPASSGSRSMLVRVSVIAARASETRVVRAVGDRARKVCAARQPAQLRQLIGE